MTERPDPYAPSGVWRISLPDAKPTPAKGK